ncbi:MAG: hypothetical protein HYY16_07405 [Planctomycetes bacterium]|nr:hypothetical protein [Planctomycetota bacterium]
MIRINLLPAEKRKPERTFRARTGLVMVGVDAAAITVVALVCALLYMRVSDVQRKIDDQTKVRDSLAGAVKEHGTLSQSISALSTQVSEIQQTVGRKVEWWRAMDALWDVIQQNPRIWVSEIQVLDARTAEGQGKKYNPEFSKKPPYGLLVRCHCAGKEVSALTKFRMDLKRSPDLNRWFGEINWDAQWRTSDEREFVEKFRMDFEVALIGQAPPAVKAAPAGAAR